MNILNLVSVFFAIAGVVYGQQEQTTNLIINSCSSSLTALPPDPKSRCCGVDGVSGSKIIGDTVTNIDDYPWLALIEYIKDGEAKTPCSGSLISNRYVLTASHCVVAVTVKPENIILGEYDTSNEDLDCVTYYSEAKDCTEGVTRIPIEKTIPHPEYTITSKNHRNDIALIRMAQAAPYTDFIRPICLPIMDISQETDNIFLRKASWGLFESKESNSIKREVTLPFVPQDKCQTAYNGPRRNITLWKGQICAGGDKVKDFCIGDAGAPLSYINGGLSEIIGIVSFGPSCSGIMPTVYTNVYEYKSWIMSNIDS